MKRKEEMGKEGSARFRWQREWEKWDEGEWRRREGEVKKGRGEGRGGEGRGR